MNSHILSDIEVLCDRVAILKLGKLAHLGHLDELRRRAGETDCVEVIATGTQIEPLLLLLPDRDKFRVSATASGVRIELADEKHVDEAISALRKARGKLVSVQPVRQSLEDLFLESPVEPSNAS
jgi:ABC-2 type transport system ATP-binding protein